MPTRSGLWICQRMKRLRPSVWVRAGLPVPPLPCWSVCSQLEEFRKRFSVSQAQWCPWQDTESSWWLFITEVVFSLLSFCELKLFSILISHWLCALVNLFVITRQCFLLLFFVVFLLFLFWVMLLQAHPSQPTDLWLLTAEPTFDIGMLRLNCGEGKNFATVKLID